MQIYVKYVGFLFVRKDFFIVISNYNYLKINKCHNQNL
jgi:hypothetical protein